MVSPADSGGTPQDRIAQIISMRTYAALALTALALASPADAWGNKGDKAKRDLKNAGKDIIAVKNVGSQAEDDTDHARRDISDKVAGAKDVNRHQGVCVLCSTPIELWLFLSIRAFLHQAI